jgi:hypothetical protein
MTLSSPNIVYTIQCFKPRSTVYICKKRYGSQFKIVRYLLFLIRATHLCSEFPLLLNTKKRTLLRPVTTYTGLQILQLLARMVHKQTLTQVARIRVNWFKRFLTLQVNKLVGQIV